MSIIYKGLNPKHHYGLCILTINGELITANGKHFQAIQIPTPHGRLIDGGELYKDFENHCGGECDCCVHETENYNCGLIANAPTILEAEE